MGKKARWGSVSTVMSWSLELVLVWLPVLSWVLVIGEDGLGIPPSTRRGGRLSPCWARGVKDGQGMGAPGPSRPPAPVRYYPVFNWNRALTSYMKLCPAPSGVSMTRVRSDTRW